MYKRGKVYVGMVCNNEMLLHVTYAASITCLFCHDSLKYPCKAIFKLFLPGNFPQYVASKSVGFNPHLSVTHTLNASFVFCNYAKLHCFPFAPTTGGLEDSWCAVYSSGHFVAEKLVMQHFVERRVYKVSTFLSPPISS